uniref:Uncharacterized protein n=1 Tax=Rhizophora mucronata TaxID=61149 RepID=A0A2P2N3S7_RHIMU
MHAFSNLFSGHLTI